MTTIQQLLGDVRIARDVLELARNGTDTVEVRAQTDMGDAGYFDNVFDMVDHIPDASRRDGMLALPLRQSRLELALLRIAGLQLASSLERVLPDPGRFRHHEAREEVHHHDAAVLGQ